MSKEFINEEEVDMLDASLALLNIVIRMLDSNTDTEHFARDLRINYFAILEYQHELDESDKEVGNDS